MERICLTEGVYFILLSLLKPNHGYGIMTEVSTLTNNEVNIGAGTLYGAINVLLEKGWITELEGEKRKKIYMITKEGKTILFNEITRLEKMLSLGKKLMEV